MLSRIEKGIHAASKWGLWASSAFLFIMMLGVVVDVSARLVGKPVKGFYDIGEVLMVALTYSAVAYAQYEKTHVRVDILLGRFPKRFARFLDTLMMLASAGVSGLITWAMASRAASIISSPGQGPVTGLLEITHTPFIIIVAIGCFLMMLEFLVDAVRSAVHLVRKGPGVYPVGVPQ
jgi:TRAP-type C4-dicarboxylate transport system permease small subunit